MEGGVAFSFGTTDNQRYSLYRGVVVGGVSSRFRSEVTWPERSVKTQRTKNTSAAMVTRLIEGAHERNMEAFIRAV